MDTARYVLAVFLVATLAPGIAWWYAVHPFAGAWRRLGPRATVWILGAVSVVCVVLLVLARRYLIRGDLGGSLPLAVVGFAMWGAAVWIEISCRKYLTRRILAGFPELSADAPGEVLQEGIYGRIRHPRYVAITVSMVGLSLVANYRSLYLATAIMIAALYGVVLLEERELRQRFGEAYVDYARRVPRFVPRWRPPAAAG